MNVRDFIILEKWFHKIDKIVLKKERMFAIIIPERMIEKREKADYVFVYKRNFNRCRGKFSNS